MTAKDLFYITENTDVRNALSDMSAAFSRNIGIQKTILAHAWIAIAEKPKDYTIKAYIGIGYAVMRNKYEIYYMPVDSKYASWDAGNQRARKILKKYIKSNQ